MKWKWVVCWGVVVFIMSGHVSGQGFFKQNKTYLKRTGEQIALFQLYFELLKKGYHIVEDGINLINAIKHGDFNIHNSYFNSLKNINPVMKKYSKVNEITDWYEKIARLYHQATEVTTDALFSAVDRDAVEAIFAGLLSEANKNLVQLKTLTTAGNYTLKDDERLQRIEALWTDMRDKYVFARDFAHSVTLLRLQKHRDFGDAEGVLKMEGLKD